MSNLYVRQASASVKVILELTGSHCNSDRMAVAGSRAFYFAWLCVISDPKQRLAMFRKLEEMSRVRPVALQPKQRPPRLDYFKGKTYVANMYSYVFMLLHNVFIMQYIDDDVYECEESAMITWMKMVRNDINIQVYCKFTVCEF